MKGYRFENGRLDRRPLGLEDISHIPLPSVPTYLENNISFLAVSSGIITTGVIGPTSLATNFYLTSFLIYGESTNEFLTSSGHRLDVLLLIEGSAKNAGSIVFFEILPVTEFVALPVDVLGVTTYKFGWQKNFNTPIQYAANNQILLRIWNYNSPFGVVNYYAAVAGFYE